MCSTSDEYNASVETDMVWDAVETFLPKLIDCASYILRRDSLIARIAHYVSLQPSVCMLYDMCSSSS